LGNYSNKQVKDYIRFQTKFPESVRCVYRTDMFIHIKLRPSDEWFLWKQQIAVQLSAIKP